jgi:hypothetical protein
MAKSKPDTYKLVMGMKKSESRKWWESLKKGDRIMVTKVGKETVTVQRVKF